MKKTILLFMLLCMAGMLVAQKGKKPAVNPHYALYKQSMAYGDYTVARSALLNLIVEQPDNMGWKDTLLTIYGLMGMYEQSILLGEEILKKRPNDTLTLKVVALSYESLGAYSQAIDYYEKALALHQDLVIRYKLAICQYGLKRYGEAMANVDQILSNAEVGEKKVTITYESGSQEIMLAAAVLNVGGIILTETGKNAEAAYYFENALKLEPQFLLAQNNLKLIQSSSNPNGK